MQKPLTFRTSSVSVILSQMSKKVGLWEYTRAVVSQGAGLWTGASVTITVWLLDHLIKADWWHRPSATFYVVVASLGLTVAQFMAWRSLYLEKSVDRNRLLVQSFLDHLTYAWDMHQPLDLMKAGLYKRTVLPSKRRPAVCGPGECPVEDWSVSTDLSCRGQC
jgi:hypothetical protein